MTVIVERCPKCDHRILLFKSRPVIICRRCRMVFVREGSE